VDHILGGDQKAHLGVDGNHQGIVHLGQIELALVFLIVNFRLRGGDFAHELNIFTEILVLPLPLIAGNLDIQLCFGGVVEVDEGTGGWNGHHNEDQGRDHGPGDLHRGALMEIGSFIALRFAVHDHAVKHDSEYDHTDDHAHPENQHVQIIDLSAHFRDALRHVQPFQP